MSPARRRAAIKFIRRRFPEVSERQACRLIGQHRSTQRYAAQARSADADLAAMLRRLAERHPYWGYKSAHRELVRRGWKVNRKRVERVWREQDLRARRKQASGKKALGTAENAIWTLPAERPNHVWALDFIGERSAGGQPYRVLNVLDEYTRRCLACVVDVSIGARRVQQALEQLFDEHGPPAIIRTDNGREFIAETLTSWLASKGVAARPVEKASPQQNALIETFHATMRRELLNWESFDTMLEARVMIEDWRRRYNGERQHTSLNDKTPNDFMKEEDRRARKERA